MDIIAVCDYIAMIGTVICLNIASKTYKVWLWYLIPTILFIIVVSTKGLVGSTILGIALIITGIRNYLTGRRNANNERTTRHPKH